MSQVTEQSVSFQTALASIMLIQASAVLDLTEDDFDFLTSNKVWIATDGSRGRRCVEACVYGTLDFVGYPRLPAPVEFIAAVIAYYGHPFFFSSRRRHTRSLCDWSSDVCSSDLSETYQVRPRGRRKWHLRAVDWMIECVALDGNAAGSADQPFEFVARRELGRFRAGIVKIGRASCRERV